MKLQSVITEMLLALTADIEYIRHHGNAQIKLRNGKLVETAGSVFVYEFTVPPLQRIDPDTEVEIRVDNITSSGRIITYTEEVAQVDIEQHLGDRIPNAILVVANYRLLEALKSRLEKIRDGDIKLGELTPSVFTNHDFPLHLKQDYRPGLALEKRLNTYQLDATRAALGSPVSFIWGPPGTGKTQTLASIIEGYLSQSKSVLLLSHTNKATDEALYKAVIHLGDDHKDYQNGKIVRFGDISLPELRDECVSPEKIAAQQGETLQKSLQKLAQEIGELSKKIGIATTALKYFDELRTLEQKVTDLRQFIEARQHAIKTHNSDMQRKKKERIHLQKTLSRYSSSRIRRLLAGRKLDITRQRIVDIEQYIQKHTKQIQLLDRKISEARKEIDNLLSKKAILQKHAPIKDIDHYQKTSKQYNDQLHTLKQDQRNIRTQFEKLKDDILLNATVVATTLTKSYMSKAILSREYDCVILDEASMAPLPAILCASGLARRHIVIVGDFLQLPPVVQYKPETANSVEARAVGDWLVRDIFAVSGITQAVKDGKIAHKMRQLKQQYRMHESIAEIVNHIAYGQFGDDYSLKTAALETTHRWPQLLKATPAPDTHLAFYDTSARGANAIRLSNGSYYNLHNALTCVALAAEASKNGYTSIGIISAYRAQANLLRSIVADEFDGATTVDADTVHRFQGGEKQLIIIDITTSDKRSLYANSQQDTAVKLLNVAISRAQQKCLLVGDLQAIAKHDSNSPISKVVELFKTKHYPTYSTQDVVDEFRESEQTDAWLQKLSPNSVNFSEIDPPLLVDETDFYGQFMRDILSAQQEVIIESPYMTTRRVNELFPYLEHLRRKGIEIYILTRSLRDHDSVMRQYAEIEFKRLSKLGIKVLAFPGKVHRKLAIIDRQILWEGSLNILSQNDSREAMWRTTGEHSTSQILQFLHLDKNLGKIGSRTLQHCDYCTEPEAWYWTERGKYGGYRTTCLVRQHTSENPPIKPSETDDKTAITNAPTCPIHHRKLVQRSGRYGYFYGCPLYPSCSVTVNIPDTAVA
jgi:hypothetical protein